MMPVRSMADLLKEQEDAMGSRAPKSPPRAESESSEVQSVPSAATAAPIEPQEFARPIQSPVPPRRPPARISARTAVALARESSRREPKGWVPYTTQLPDALDTRLLRRLAADQVATKDFQLGQLHYLNAAFGRVPGNPEGAARLAVAWRDRKVEYGEMIRSGSSLQQAVALAMRQLRTPLKLLPQRVWVWEVQAEALARLLDELDQADA
jgi:hypothetical protein